MASSRRVRPSRSATGTNVAGSTVCPSRFQRASASAPRTTPVSQVDHRLVDDVEAGAGQRATQVLLDARGGPRRRPGLSAVPSSTASLRLGTRFASRMARSARPSRSWPPAATPTDASIVTMRRPTRNGVDQRRRAAPRRSRTPSSSRPSTTTANSSPPTLAHVAAAGSASRKRQRDGAQHLVADAMAGGVVDRPEPVEVAVDDRGALRVDVDDAAAAAASGWPGR